MRKQQLFCLLSGLSLSIPAFCPPLYAQTTPNPVITKPIVKPVVKPIVVKPKAKTTVAKPKPKTDVAQPKTTPAETMAKTPNLEVTFKELKTSTGQMCLSLFSGPKGFPKGGSDSDLVVSKCTPVANSAAAFTFSDLKPGNYAITAFHDVNNDGKMNKTAFGMPEEGFGFSNNPTIGFSAPSFDETKFPVATSKAVVSIQLKYF
jgi:uncharacterized protein (DUF2141 family)